MNWVATSYLGAYAFSTFWSAAIFVRRQRYPSKWCIRRLRRGS